MSKMNVKLFAFRSGRGHRKQLKLYPLIDSGSDMTLFPSFVGRDLHLVQNNDIEQIKIMGVTIPFWFVNLNLYIPDTDCLIENFRVGIAIDDDEVDDLSYPILGTDFLQQTGGILDFGKDRHAIVCDARARGEHSDAPRVAIRKRLRHRG